MIPPKVIDKIHNTLVFTQIFIGAVNLRDYIVYLRNKKFLFLLVTVETFTLSFLE